MLDDHTDGRRRLLHGYHGLDQQMLDVVGIADDRERRVLREVLHLLEPVMELIGAREHVFGEAHQLPACRRHLRACALPAVEQGTAQQAFQMADAL
ncbi:hypothetical protein [Nonomuraea rosea]|uniref:hypothetical protein n=1 Tax=Nonomuraea rosea TaxID=638574 RepID=UPI0031EBCADC